MNLHLQYTADDYEQQPDARGVCPISRGDAAIIDELIGVVKREGLDDLSTILNKWKHNSDEATYKMLKGYSDGVPVEDIDEDSEEKDIYALMFIEIKKQMFRVASIFNIATSDEYVEDRMHYNIIINRGPIPAQFAWYLDTKIVCYSDEERENLVNQVKNKLKKYNLCKFI